MSSATTVSNPLSESLIGAAIENDECPFCGGHYTEIDEQRVCERCWCTPYGTFIDPPAQGVDEDESTPTRDRYQRSETVILFGGFEEAYRDPTNGISYCLEVMDHEYHDGLVIWNHCR